MKTKIKKQTGRILVAALAILFAIGFAPQMSAPAYADDGDPDISLSTDQLAKNAAEDGAQIVNYGGREWYVIAYDGKDGNGNVITYEDKGGNTVALHPEGAVALYQKGVMDGEQSYFCEAGYPAPPYHYAYGYVDLDGNTPSTLRKTIESIYVTGDNACISASEQAAILPRTLKGGNQPLDTRYWPGAHDKNTIACGDVEGAVVWPLSVAEAQNVAGSILADQDGESWLRIPGCPVDAAVSIELICAAKLSYGYVNENGDDTREEKGVRPGFYLDINQVMFTSSAYGGKASGKIGPGALKKVGENDDGEWKMTLLTSASEQFNITMEDPEDCVTPKFQYEGAFTGKNAYISAIIVDSDETIKYYGRIKQCADDADASGELTIDLKGKIKEGEDLLVFNEQCNGDGKTDYSSVPRFVDIPDSNAPHHLSKTDQAAATMDNPGNKEYWTCSKCGRYFGDDGGTQLIDKDSWVIACPSIFNVPAVTYNGHEQTPAVSVADTNAQVISADNYDVEYGNNVNAGTNATAKVTFKGDFYSGEENLTFTIKPASVAGASVTGVTSRIYTGKAQTQKPVVKIGGTTLQNNTDYVLSYKDNIKAGTAAVLIKGKGNYSKTKTVKFTIKKATNLLKVKGKTAAVKYSALKKKNQSVGVTRVVAFKNKGQGAKTYTKASGNKKIIISKKTGKVTVKKGLKKGTYKVTVKVKAAGNANYKASDVKKVEFKISVK